MVDNDIGNVFNRSWTLLSFIKNAVGEYMVSGTSLAKQNCRMQCET
jgi:hypothetical protein